MMTEWRMLAFSILIIKLCQSCQLFWSRGQVIETNLTPDSISEHEKLYNDIPPVQRKSGPKGWLPCT